MVEVFKTNVQHVSQSEALKSVLSERHPLHRINFDLTDCDKILRVEGESINAPEIIVLVNGFGFMCELLH